MMFPVKSLFVLTNPSNFHTCQLVYKLSLKLPYIMLFCYVRYSNVAICQEKHISCGIRFN